MCRKQDSKLEFYREALRQTELRLDDMSSLADNADRRAMAFAASFAGLAFALLSFLSQLPNMFVGLLTVVALVICALRSVSSCLPRDFHIRGTMCRKWEEHLEDNDINLDSISAQARENDQRLKFNEIRLDEAGQKVTQSFRWAVYSLWFFAGGQFGEILDVRNIVLLIQSAANSS